MRGEPLTSPTSPGSIGVDPLDSILPDNGDDNIQVTLPIIEISKNIRKLTGMPFCFGFEILN